MLFYTYPVVIREHSADLLLCRTMFRNVYQQVGKCLDCVYFLSCLSGLKIHAVYFNPIRQPWLSNLRVRLSTASVAQQFCSSVTENIETDKPPSIIQASPIIVVFLCLKPQLPPRCCVCLQALSSVITPQQRRLWE